MIFISIENNRVKKYQIGSSSSTENIQVPNEYSLSDLEHLIIEINEQINQIPKMVYNEQTASFEQDMDEQGNPIFEEEIVITHLFSLDPNKNSIEQTKQEQRAMSDLRQKRDVLLCESDFSQLVDAPLTEPKKEEYRQYRQALRDLPSTVVDVLNPIFPSKPE